MRLCISHFPPDYPERLQRGRLGFFFNRLALYLRRRRNPRTPEYMEALCMEKFGKDYMIIDVAAISSASLGKASEIVLLWPDGNGYGWAAAERKIFNNISDKTKLNILNGRRRFFTFTKELQIQYLFRRIAERFWIAEILSTTIFIIVTPILLIWDLFKGRS